MIIGNDIVLNVEDFLGAMINSYLLFAPYADLSYDEIAQLLEEYFCDYIAQYGIVILKLYTKKTEKGIFIDYKYTYEYNVQLFVQFLSYPQGHVVDINKMISFLSGENGSGIRHP